MSIITGGEIAQGTFGPFLHDGTPIDGITLAGTAAMGATLIDTSAAISYINIGTQASPIWSEVATLVNGIKFPSYTTTEMEAIANPETGAVVYNTTDGVLYIYGGAAWKTV